MRVLVFGDSNSWGTLADGLGIRAPRRWPVVMADALGCALIEDCVPGRTTVHDDPVMEAEVAVPSHAFNGLVHLPASLIAAAPIDRVLIMLGTNDLKTRFDPSVDKIAGNIARLVDAFAGMRFGNGPWADAPAPLVGVIAPVPLGLQADDPTWERYPEWLGARAISCALYQELKDRLAVPVLDAGVFASASSRDPIHFEPDQHESLGQGIAEWMRSEAW